ELPVPSHHSQILQSGRPPPTSGKFLSCRNLGISGQERRSDPFMKPSAHPAGWNSFATTRILTLGIGILLFRRRQR
ncbi:hypothetical protein NPIL_620241, partial [Nephila pilipes]